MVFDMRNCNALFNLAKSHLDCNLISSLTILSLSGLSNLVEFHENQITLIEVDTFKTLICLQLFLNNNEMTCVSSRMVEGLVRLQELWLNKIKITYLDLQNFFGLESLIYLKLSDNKLNSLCSGSFETLANLEVLDLKRNQIKSVEIDVILNLPKLKHLFLVK